MLSVGTDVKGSAAYVAIERVTGTLHGRAGSFVLQHNGTMTRGEPQLSVAVVPDSEFHVVVAVLLVDLVGGRNLHLWTKFDGRDPEVNGADGLVNPFRADVETLPQVRRAFARLNLQF